MVTHFASSGPAMTSLGTAATTQPFSITITSSVASSPVLTAPIKPSSTSVLQHSVQIASTTTAGSTHVLTTSSQLSVSATSSSLVFNASRGTSQRSTTLVLSSTPLVLSSTPLVLSSTPLVLSSTPLVLPAASSSLNEGDLLLHYTVGIIIEAIQNRWIDVIY